MSKDNVSTLRVSGDWITQMNEVAGDEMSDRDVLEEMIIFLNKRRLGPAFVTWFKANKDKPLGERE